jgi:hypothetical protein
VTGIPAVDEIGLPSADRRALGKVVAAHPHLRRIVAGHLHLAVSGELGGRGVLAAPSTYVQAELDFSAAEIRLAAEPAGFIVHAFLDGEIVSYVEAVR